MRGVIAGAQQPEDSRIFHSHLSSCTRARSYGLEPVPIRAHRAPPPPAGNPRTKHNSRKLAQHHR